MRNSCLGHAVNGFGGKGNKSSLRAEVDDPAVFLLDHHPTGSLTREEGTFQVDGERQIEILFAHVLCKIARSQTGVVHQNIQTTETLYGGIDRLLNFIEASYIHL
jgi:hypothetical protein